MYVCMYVCMCVCMYVSLFNENMMTNHVKVQNNKLRGYRTINFPGKLKEFCRYHMNLSYSGMQTFPVHVEFGAWKRGRTGRPALFNQKWTRSLTCSVSYPVFL